MTWEWLALTGLALAAVVLLLALARLRGRTNRQVDAARAEAAELRARLDRLEQERSEAVRPPVRDQRDHRITGVGVSETGPRPSSTADEYEIQPARLERAVFADHMLREGVIRLGSLAHGVRRGLSAETRNRIRFEMKREVRRTRKQRHADMRTAHREWQARQRDALGDDIDDGPGFRDTA